MTALLIVYRVAVGKAWNGDTHEAASTLRAGSTIQFSNVRSLHDPHSMGGLDHEQSTVTEVGSPRLVCDISAGTMDKGGQDLD